MKIKIGALKALILETISKVEIEDALSQFNNALKTSLSSTEKNALVNAGDNNLEEAKAEDVLNSAEAKVRETWNGLSKKTKDTIKKGVAIGAIAAPFVSSEYFPGELAIIGLMSLGIISSKDNQKVAEPKRRTTTAPPPRPLKGSTFQPERRDPNSPWSPRTL